MATRGKVGKTASNALRSYNRIINNVTEQCDKYRELSSILGRNMKMAVVYSNKDGYVKYIGDETFVNIIADKCEEDILVNSAWEEGDVPNTIERVVLPNWPAPVSRLNAKDMQHILPNVMRNLRGGGYVKWGSDDNKPVWWPEDVVFANVKQRPQQQKSGDRWVDCLRKIVSNMYGHYGYNAETYVDNSVESDTSDNGDTAVHNNADDANGFAVDHSGDDANRYAEHSGDDANAYADHSGDDANRYAEHSGDDANRYAEHSGDDANVHAEHSGDDANGYAEHNGDDANGYAEHSGDDANGCAEHNGDDANGYAEHRGDDTNGYAEHRGDDAYGFAVELSSDDAKGYAVDHSGDEAFGYDVDQPDPRTSTPLQNKIPLQNKTPKTTPVLLPLHLSGKRNWSHRENDPAVKDFVNNSPGNSPLPKKRRIKPRNIFTPSKYM